MHDNRLIVEDRIERVTRELVTPAIYRATAPLQVEAWLVPDEPVPAAEALTARYTEVALPLPWGTPWSTTWFHGTGRVPAEWFSPAGDLPENTRAEVLIDLGFYGDRPGFQSEGLAYRPDGSIIKAVSPRSSYLPWDDAAPGSPIEVFIEAAANPDVAGEYDFLPTPLGLKSTAGEAPIYTLRTFEIALLDVPVWELSRDLWTLTGLMHELDPGVARRHRILRGIEEALDLLDPDNISGTAAGARAILAPLLESPASASSHEIVAIGHAHIDTAWLWPLRETVRKCARTFSNVLDLMERYPDFRFACSSAQQLFWIKQHYPDLFERIRVRVGTGQFIPVGGMWVEPDMNMPGGEAMSRQFVAGKRFFQEEFGVDTREVWVPDTFGYSAALPQIIAASGSEWFLTQKISWNQINTLPHHTFLWEGIDGTQIFTHFPPADTYVAELSGAEVAHAERTFRENGAANLSLVPFGWGDGGGGPTREMIAAARRLADLEGSPRVGIDSPEAFFERAQAEYPNPPVWSGELYLELHRGSLTSQHRMKQEYRRGEHRLREAELWATTAAVRAGIEYPYATLETAWQHTLLQQFHDILPGCSIAWVYEDVAREAAEHRVALEEIINTSVHALAGEGTVSLIPNARPDADGGVPALGIGVAEQPERPATVRETADGWELENGIIVARVDTRGLLVSLRDLVSGREAIAPGSAANLLQVHRDIPNKWDAWDIDDHYRRVCEDLVEAENIEVEERGDATVSLRVTRRYGDSVIVQTVSLGAGRAALDLRVDADWQERRKLLKLAFPLDVHADRSAAETQFGHVYRPTHTNTSWDAARFEVCAHRWVHVGEPGYGVALANESSYGHDINRITREDDGGSTTTVRVSLLRGPQFPDPEADRGEHTLSLSLRPGADIRAAIEEGYRLNLPTRTLHGERAVAPLVTSSNPAVRIEAVKLAEDRSGDVVVRLYESEGTRATVTIAADFTAAAITTTDLLEREIPAPAGSNLADTTATLTLRPFQLVTLRFARA